MSIIFKTNYIQIPIRVVINIFDTIVCACYQNMKVQLIPAELQPHIAAIGF